MFNYDEDLSRLFTSVGTRYFMNISFSVYLVSDSFLANCM